MLGKIVLSIKVFFIGLLFLFWFALDRWPFIVMVLLSALACWHLYFKDDGITVKNFNKWALDTGVLSIIIMVICGAVYPIATDGVEFAIAFFDWVIRFYDARIHPFLFDL